MNKTINDIIDNLDMVGDRTLSTLMEKAVIEEVSPLLARIDELEGAIREHKKIMGGEATKADRELWTVLESKSDNI